jgi:hypothetical protein
VVTGSTLAGGDDDEDEERDSLYTQPAPLAPLAAEGVWGRGNTLQMLERRRHRYSRLSLKPLAIRCLQPGLELPLFRPYLALSL